MSAFDRHAGVITASAVAIAASATLIALSRTVRHRKSSVDKWEETMLHVLPAIVVIRCNYVRSFDGDHAGSCGATGFVVDAEAGLILTNRHVVSTGPVRAEATFINKEEVQLTPVYRDPIHDFGFFRFDPKAVKYMKVTEIKMAPDDAQVGVEIRVVGNDAGEKLSILSGVLARLDRNAPHYATDSYNDFNTFYYSAASNTSGGSSGSPVLNMEGCAIALNAGGSEKAASSFYLPLHRVKRTLDCIRNKSAQVSRGTEHIVWRHQTYNELQKLGLRASTEKDMREQQQKLEEANQVLTGHHLSDGGGLLVVDQLVPNGPAQGKLDVGDILLGIKLPGDAEEFEDCTNFTHLEDVLDSNVGQIVHFKVERGGKELSFGVQVQDLNALTPRIFLEAGGGALHPLSFMQARNGNLRLDCGVYVASAGFVLDAAGVGQHSIITQVGSVPTPTLSAYQEAMAELPDGTTSTLRYFNIGDQHNEQVAMIRVNHRWFPITLWERHDDVGVWRPKPVTIPRRDVIPQDPQPVKFLLNRSETANKIISSICKVSFNVLHAVDGVHEWHFVGAGIVVDEKRGLVIVDRNTIVNSLGEVAVSFAATVEVPARILYMHPVHNFAVIQYDPKNFQPDTIRAAVLSPEPLKVGDSLEFVGLCRTNADTCVSQMVDVSEISCINIPQANVPRFRAMNEEIAKFDQVVNKSLGGALVDSSGKVRALWMCYGFYSWNDEKNYESFHALGVDLICDVLEPFLPAQPETTAGREVPLLYPLPLPEPRDRTRANSQDGTVTSPPRDNNDESAGWFWPRLRSLDLGFKRFPLSTARTNMKLPKMWVDHLQACHPGRSQVLLVSQRLHASPSAKVVNEGDLVLAIDGTAVCTFRDVEMAVANKPAVDLTLLRNEEVMNVKVETTTLDCLGTSRVLIWAGLLLQPSYRPIQEMGEGASDIYCSYYLFGSPAHFYNLKACRYITAVNETEVRTLDDMRRTVEHIPDGAPVKLRCVDLQGQAMTYTLKTDYLFWPTQELRRDPSGQVDWHSTI